MHIHEEENEDETKNWQINKIEEESEEYKNIFMEVLHFMEKSTYPLVVKVDDRGVFLEAIEHSKNVERWKKRVETLGKKYNNVDQFIHPYLETMQNEELFYKNKYKESFWNLFFFAPTYINTGYRNEESIVWNLKTIGDIECAGILRAEKKNYGFDSHFISEIETEKDLTDLLNKKFSKRLLSYKIELNIRMS